MPQLANQLELDRCPHCSVHKPMLTQIALYQNLAGHSGGNSKNWAIYKCATCGNLVSAYARPGGPEVVAWYPTSEAVHADVPREVARFLQQAMDSLHAPDGAVVLAASAVDAMLKLKGYIDGKLNSRIKKAAEDNLITPDMAEWAHDVRLDANDTRHADIAAVPPTFDDAKRAVSFAQTLAEILFVLPERVKRGRTAPTTP